MKFLNHQDKYLIVNIIFLIAAMNYFIIGTYQLAHWPTAHTTWNIAQANWHQLNSLWLLAIINTVVYLIFSYFFWRGKYFIFIFMALYIDYFINHPFQGVNMVMYHVQHGGFPILNLYGFFCVIQFGLALIGVLKFVQRIPKDKWYSFKAE